MSDAIFRMTANGDAELVCFKCKTRVAKTMIVTNRKAKTEEEVCDECFRDIMNERRQEKAKRFLDWQKRHQFDSDYLGQLAVRVIMKAED
jgi:hypothetical protein